MKRWIQDELVPPPVLIDTVRQYKHYDEDELQLIAEVLRSHEKDFSYLHHTHEHLVHQIWQRIEAYRK